MSTRTSRNTPERGKKVRSATQGATRAPKTATRNVPSEEERRRMIAEAAYYRAQQRGFSAGGEVDDWLAAEREVAQQFQAH